MTRKGKIARLPNPVREQINLRLQNGEEAKHIAAWLNTLPQVQRLLTAEFDGQPVTEQNLSNWKLGGYQDWLSLQESLEATRRFGADSLALQKAGGIRLTEHLALCLTARLGVALRHTAADPADPSAQLEHLRHLCAQVVGLRRGDHEAERLDLERQRVELDRKKWNHKTAVERKELEEKANPRNKAVPRAVLNQVVKELNLL